MRQLFKYSYPDTQLCDFGLSHELHCRFISEKFAENRAKTIENEKIKICETNE